MINPFTVLMQPQLTKMDGEWVLVNKIPYGYFETMGKTVQKTLEDQEEKNINGE